MYPQQGTQQISKHIYGQFAEHLGTCIYGGLWVGPDSDIPNTQGYRNDVLNALKKLQIPNLRWPGGCFADEYHWMDGIGPKENRPKMVNNNWGGTIEDNSFGTHEFLNLCELLGCEPYISANVGSGTVEEMAKWIEYMTSEGDSPMARLRRQNGRDKAWNVKFIGVGNESWGCGGSMRPEYYADLYRRYSTYCRNYDGNRLFKIASGASDYDYNWTEVLMKNVGGRMDGLSLHYYTVPGDWKQKGPATGFDKVAWYRTLKKSLYMEELLTRHGAIMDSYDPAKRVALVVDEWGAWYDVEPGTNPGFLYQQNSMRDAALAALTLNLFNHHTNVQTSNRVVCIVLKGMGENLRKIAMHITNEFVTQAVDENYRAGVATWCYFDEFHVLLRDQLTASYFVAVWKMLRKKGCVPSALTQNVKDLLASAEISNILDNTDFMVLLSQAQSDRAILAKQLGISEHQLSYITHSNSGEGLLFYGNVTIPFIDRFPRGEIYDLLTTRPEDMAHERKDE